MGNLNALARVAEHYLARTAQHPAVVGTAVVLPPHHYGQEELARFACEVLPGLDLDPALLTRLFRRVGVGERYLALPAERYSQLRGLEDRNLAWLEVATDLGQQCVEKLLREAEIEAADVSMLMTTTVTGIAVPSLDARLMNRLPFAPDLKRVPLFGLGCLGGAAGLARASEYLRAYPNELAILLSVELCSLTLQLDDPSIANAISAGLFGDGAAAVLLAGAAHPLAAGAGAGPRVEASRSVFFPDTERTMGWDVVDGGFKIVLSPGVPELVRSEIPGAVDAFLADHDLTRHDIVTWVSHPGGPKVLSALEEGLELPEGALDATREGLRDVGNLSSASVLYLLDEFRVSRRPSTSSQGILLAMGPAFCAELVLLRW